MAAGVPIDVRVRPASEGPKVPIMLEKTVLPGRFIPANRRKDGGLGQKARI